MKYMKLLGITAILLSAATANAAVSFDVGGLVNSGVTANISFGYTAIDANNGTITISITNTTLDSGDTAGAFITAFAFNTPGAFTITSIGGDVDDAGTQETTQLASPPNVAEWYARYDTNNISTPNAAGDFDFGVMNNDTVNAFITDGTGGPNSPKIHIGETTTFTLAVTGSGLNGLSDSAFLEALSVGGNAGAFNFGVRFQGVGGEGSDLATTTIVPVPAAVLLGAFGLFGVGVTRRTKK